MFRRTRNSAPHDPYRIEWVPMTLAELEVFARVMLAADRAMTRRRPDLGNLAHATKDIGHLYQRVGAASLSTQDPARVRIPVQKAEIHDVERAVHDLDFYNGPADVANEGRHLFWLLQARLGRERAVFHAGGTPMFTGHSPTAVVVDDEDQAVPVDFPQLPAGGRRG